MNPMRIGVVGPGLIWKSAHRPAIEALGDAIQIVALSATSDKTRREVEATYPGVPFFTDYHDLIGHPEVEYVLVLTPIALNAPVASAAVRAGKHVILEKPMARTLEEALALVAEAQAHGRKLWILEQDGYRRSWPAIRELLAAGEIGQVVSYERIWHSLFVSRGDPTRDGATLWRQQPEFILGTLFDGGHHAIAALSALFGAPQGLYASAVSLRQGFGEFDHELVLLEYASGVRGVLSHASYLSGARDGFIIRGTGGLLDFTRHQLLLVKNDGSERALPSHWEASHDDMWAALVQAHRTGGEPAYTAGCGLRELSILYAIHDSAHRHQRIDVAYAPGSAR